MFCICEKMVSIDGIERKCGESGKIRKTRLFSPSLEKEEYHLCDKYWQALQQYHQEKLQSN